MDNNILMLGTGSIAKRHIQNILSTKKKKNIYIYSKNFLRSKNFCSHFKKKNVFPLQNLKNTFKFNHVFIASNTSLHNKSLIEFIDKKNCKIYCEKPLPNDKNFKLLKQLSKNNKNNKKISIGFQFRFNPLINFLKKELQKTENKKINFIQFNCGQNLNDWRKNYDYTKYHSAGNKKYSSVFWELCHEIDILNYIFEKPKKIISIFSKSNELKIDSHDISVTSFKFSKKKTICVISVEMLSPILYRKLTIATSNNYYEADLVKNVLIKKNKNKEQKFMFNTNRNYMFKACVENFLDTSKKKK